MTPIPPLSAGPRGPRPTHRLTQAADVVAAIPYLLGFRPQSSIIALGLRRGTNEVTVTARIDLPTTPAEATECGSALAGALRRSGAGQVTIVVCWPKPPDPDDEALLQTVRQGLRRAGLRVRGEIEIDNDDVPRPALAPLGAPVPALAVEAVVSGRRVYDDRNEVVALVRHRPGAAADRLDQAIRRLERLHLPSVDLDVALATLTRSRRTARDEGVTRPPAGHDELAMCCLALADIAVRDRFLGALCTIEGAPYHDLLVQLCRSAPPSRVAPAATVLAAAAYLCGDGVLARCSLERALTADPGYSLGRLIEVALDHALPPEQLRRALTESFRAAGGAADTDGQVVA